MLECNIKSVNCMAMWTKFISVFFINTINILCIIRITNLTFKDKIFNLFSRFYLTFRKKDITSKVYVILISSIEKFYSVIRYYKIQSKIKKFSSRVFSFSDKFKFSAASFFITFDTSKFLLLIRKIIGKKNFKIKIFIESLTTNLYFLQQTNKFLKIANYIIFFEKNYTCNSLENKLYIECSFLFCKYLFFKKKKKIILNFRKMKTNNDFLKLFLAIKLIEKKLIIFIPFKYNLKQITNFLNILGLKIIFLSYQFPKDLIFRKIKIFNSSLDSTLIITRSFFFTKQILSKIDLREVFLISCIKKKTFKHFYLGFSEKIYHCKNIIQKKKMYFSKLI
nr:hypothetical protein Cry52Nrm2_p064 [Cryptomonas curvata]